jgi:hypothetical protein
MLTEQRNPTTASSEHRLGVVVHLVTHVETMTLRAPTQGQMQEIESSDGLG